MHALVCRGKGGGGGFAGVGTGKGKEADEMDNIKRSGGGRRRTLRCVCVLSSVKRGTTPWYDATIFHGRGVE